MVKVVTSIKYLHVYVKGGKTYVYYRRNGTRVRIKCDPIDLAGIQEAIARIEAELGSAAPAPAPRYERGTLGWVIQEYRKSDRWTSLRDTTRAGYERALVKFEPLLDKPASWLTRPRILRLRDEAWFPKYKLWLANYMVTVLGVVLAFAKDRGEIRENPLAEKVRKIRKAKGGPQANRPWTAEERRVVLEEAEPHVRLALAFFMCTGLRKTDVFNASMANIKGGQISVITSKRETPVTIPLHPYLKAALAARPGDAVGKIILREDGKKPYTADGFDTIWHRFRQRLLDEGKIGKGLTLHGLRHTLGTMLKEAGLDDGTIADVLGQARITMARHYSKNARLSKETQQKLIALDIKNG